METNKQTKANKQLYAIYKKPVFNIDIDRLKLKGEGKNIILTLV